jgi:hypothetical protein
MGASPEDKRSDASDEGPPVISQLVCFGSWGTRIVLGLLALSIPIATAQDDPEAKKRLELMQAAVGNFAAESAELKPQSALAVASKPLLRYSDPTRGGVGVKNKPVANVLVDAGVWRLGTGGRPTALVTAEIYQAPNGSRVLSFEFLSLTEKKFSLKHKTEDVRWDATASGLSLADMPKAQKPSATAAARLTEMRQLMRRFVAKELYNKEWIECRLIAQPIDRYQSEADKIVDGAIFALANGTNPEFAIVLETDGTRWQYGVLRLSSAESIITLDGEKIAAFEYFVPGGPRDGPYNSGGFRIEPPK